MSLISNLGTLASFHHRGQDIFLNPLANFIQLAALLRSARLGKTDNVVQGLATISQHINSSRFVLRFLTGAANGHALLTEPIFTQGSSTLVSYIRVLQRVLNVGYNLAELPAYVAMVAPMLTAGKYNGDAYGRLSCMFWFANIVLEAIVMMKQRKQFTATAFKWGALALACDAFLSLNWSLQPKSQFLSQWQIVMLGCVSSAIILVKTWKERNAEENQKTKEKQL